MRRQPPFRLQPLEDRANPAGGITVNVVAGVLQITGDDHANIFTIERNGSAVQVTGTNTAVNSLETPFRFDGVVNSLKVNTFGGADEIAINSALNFSLAGSALFDLGDGNNKLQLVTSDVLTLGALSVKAGDGFDTVIIQGGAGSQANGAALFQYGIGGSNTQIKNLNFAGPSGQVTLAAADGSDTLGFDNCQTKGITFSGGYGQGSLNVANSTVTGNVVLNGSQGPNSVSFVNSTVMGGVKALGSEGITLSLNNSTVTGDVVAKGGLFDLDSTVNLNFANVVNLGGELETAGYTVGVNCASGAALTITGNILGSATDAFNFNSQATTIATKGITLNALRTANLLHNVSGSSLTMTGPLTVGGRIVEVDCYELNVTKPVSINGNAKASLKTAKGTLGSLVNVVSAVGSANMLLGTVGPVGVVGNVYVSGKLTTSVGVAGTLEQNLTVNGGIKDDSFGLGMGTVKKNVTLNLKDGNNVVGIGNFQAPAPPQILGNLTINTGNGADLIGFLCNVTGATILNAGGGADTLLGYGSTFDGPVTIKMGNGEDVVQMQDGPFFAAPFTFNGKTIIDLGAGNDQLILGLAMGDPNNGGGDANSSVVFAAGLGSYVTGGTGINSYDDEAGQTVGLNVALDFMNWLDPT